MHPGQLCVFWGDCVHVSPLQDGQLGHSQHAGSCGTPKVPASTWGAGRTHSGLLQNTLDREHRAPWLNHILWVSGVSDLVDSSLCYLLNWACPERELVYSLERPHGRYTRHLLEDVSAELLGVADALGAEESPFADGGSVCAVAYRRPS